MIIKNKLYWNSFYSNNLTIRKLPPSQFSVFVLSLISDINYIIDFGCGSGRDTKFLGQFSDNTIGIDLSNSAIELCKKNDIKNTYYNGNIDLLRDLLNKICLENKTAKTLFYSRFVLHSLDEANEKQLFNTLLNCDLENLYCAFEYRTIEDKFLKKNFLNHKRRFIDHNNLIKYFEKEGFEILYKTKGLGYAYFNNEDAYVGRLILKKLQK